MSSIIKQLGKLDKMLSKKEIEDTAIDDIKAVIEEEKYDLLKVLIELKRYNIYVNKLISELKEPAFEKAKKFKEKQFEYGNAKIWITKRVSFDYSNDKTWVQLRDNALDVKLKLKEHQDFLKQLDLDTTEIIDEETGEVIEITPPRKEIKHGLRIQI